MDMRPTAPPSRLSGGDLFQTRQEDRTEARARIDGLNARYRSHNAMAVLEAALDDRDVGRLALVSSFGAESAVLLHLVARIDPTTPVLFIDTHMLFAETLSYQRELADAFGLCDMRVLRASRGELTRGDPYGALHLTDPDRCCALRKSAPLERALIGFDGWITGAKRFQSGTRAALDYFELDEASGRLKFNPLAHWSRADVQAYMTAQDLPRHPLVARGYPSIGCAPCTSPVKPGEDPRSGRWRGQSKEECGIHFENGRILRDKT